jgi:hypothetical protein
VLPDRYGDIRQTNTHSARKLVQEEKWKRKVACFDVNISLRCLVLRG